MEEEKIFNDLLNYFEENLAAEIALDLDFPHRMVSIAKNQVKAARAGEGRALIPAQMAKQISFYLKQIR